MKSGLEDRNNHTGRCAVNGVDDIVSMKSGLEDRNNLRGMATKEGQERRSQ